MNKDTLQLIMSLGDTLSDQKDFVWSDELRKRFDRVVIKLQNKIKEENEKTR